MNHSSIHLNSPPEFIFGSWGQHAAQLRPWLDRGVRHHFTNQPQRHHRPPIPTERTQLTHARDTINAILANED